MTRVLAIDGPAGAGKSTVARAIAARLGWNYLDTGAMYRAVTWRCLTGNVDLADEDAVARVARECVLSITPRVVIDGVDVTDDIRSPAVNEAVSTVAAAPKVRSELVRRQRELAAAAPVGSVVEGRDITTVVFPDATLKVYLTASEEERVRRRGDEDAGSLARRDREDSTRMVSPLRKADDAIEFDTTGYSVDEVVEEVVRCLQRLL